jgi:hypothetical protein
VAVSPKLESVLEIFWKKSNHYVYDDRTSKTKIPNLDLNQIKVLLYLERVIKGPLKKIKFTG